MVPYPAVCHELRNPLHVLKSTLGSLLNDDPESELGCSMGQLGASETYLSSSVSQSARSRDTASGTSRQRGAMTPLEPNTGFTFVNDTISVQQRKEMVGDVMSGTSDGTDDLGSESAPGYVADS